jgi:hypothetical protein
VNNEMFADELPELAPSEMKLAPTRMLTMSCTQRS